MTPENSGLRERLAHARQPLLTPIDCAVLAGVAALTTASLAGGPALGLGPALQWAGAAVGLVEAAWWAVGKLRYRALNRQSAVLPCTRRHAQLFEWFLELGDVFSLDDFLSGWFLGTPADRIPRGNVEEFVIYGFYARPPAELAPAEAGAVAAFLARVEERWGAAFPPGYDPSLRFMAHIWEPLHVAHKPLALYLATEAVARVAQVRARACVWRRRALACSARARGGATARVAQTGRHMSVPVPVPVPIAQAWRGQQGRGARAACWPPCRCLRALASVAWHGCFPPAFFPPAFFPPAFYPPAFYPRRWSG